MGKNFLGGGNELKSLVNTWKLEKYYLPFKQYPEGTELTQASYSCYLILFKKLVVR